jgi:XisI protein
MDKIEKYRAIIKQVLQKHAVGYKMPNSEEYSEQMITDDANGHYLLMGVGWQQYKRLHGISLHIDLVGEKVYIQQDWTEPGIALELAELGIPKSDMVLAFHAPYRRALIEDYAAA